MIIISVYSGGGKRKRGLLYKDIVMISLAFFITPYYNEIIDRRR